jgi:DNA sulfur modification protein DndC
MTKSKNAKTQAPLKNWTPEVIEKIQELVAQGALFFCSHSGGKDSQAMYNFLKTIVPTSQMVVVHSHLSGVEWKGVVEHIQATIEGHEFFEVKAGKTFIEMVRARGMFPSSDIKNCTSDLKRDVIEKLMKKVATERGVKVVVNCTGIRAAESKKRSRKIPIAINKRMTTTVLKDGSQKRLCWDLMPIFNWSKEDVFGYIRKSGQETHWAYGVGMSRLSCCFCILANKSDLRISAKYNPELLEELAALEVEIGHTMKMVNGKPIGIKEFIFGEAQADDASNEEGEEVA